jgi:hypothetical protein
MHKNSRDQRLKVLGIVVSKEVVGQRTTLRYQLDGLRVIRSHDFVRTPLYFQERCRKLFHW